MIMYLGNSKDYTKGKIKKRIRENPNNIENYIILSECYQRKHKNLRKVLKPIQYVEDNITKSKYEESIYARKVDIYAYYADIDVKRKKYETAWKKYYIAWKTAKRIIKEEKIDSIYEYDFEIISDYSLEKLVNNIDLLYKILISKYKK